jgi:hypothetical protein
MVLTPNTKQLMHGIVFIRSKNMGKKITEIMYTTNHFRVMIANLTSI